MIKSILHHLKPNQQQNSTFSTLLRTVLISATDKGGEGLSHSPQGHSATNTTRELSFEEQYAAKRDYELLKKLADLSQDQSKKMTNLFDKIDKSNRMHSELQNLQQNIQEMKGIIDESLASTKVANIDVGEATSPGQTPWRTQTKPKTNVENLSESSKTDKSKFLDVSHYPDLTNDL